MALGWAHIEKHAYQTFLTEAEEAPAALKGPLQLLAQLYGLTRLERSMAHYLAAGVLTGTLLPQVKLVGHKLCCKLLALPYDLT